MSKTHPLTLALATLLAACSAADDLPLAELSDLERVAPTHWTYDGPDGPRHWHELGIENEACGHRDTQSPIDLSSDIPVTNLPDVVSEYGASGVAVRNTGHTIQYDYEPGSLLRVGDRTYELMQLHFHVHSEHTIDSAHHEMELHLVHRDQTGHYLVLGVFVDAGAENRALAEAGWKHLPLEPEHSFIDERLTLDANALIPGGPSFRYEGSLTTPPCTEAVSWVVFERAITMSRAQIAHFSKAYDRDFRPVQSLGTRTLTRGE